MTRLADRAAQFIRQTQRYRRCCNRMEHEYLNNRILITDVELVYASSFLSVCSLWESLLEEFLFEIVCGVESRRPGNQRFASFKSRRHLSDILLYPGKDYLSFSEFRRAEETASLFINEGRPFSAISERNRTLLQQAVKIRNAIAHQGRHAKKQFRTHVPGVTALPRSKRLPGAFLRHEFRVSPNQRRYELYYAAYQSAATEISSAW